MIDRIKKLIELNEEQKIELVSILDELEEPSTPPPPLPPTEPKIWDISVRKISPNRVEITWDGEGDDVVDVHYYRESEDVEWKFKLSRFKKPPHISEKRTTIGFNSPIETVYFKTEVNGEFSEVLSVKLEDPIIGSLPSIEKFNAYSIGKDITINWEVNSESEIEKIEYKIDKL